jgi:NDP-sugar pyrophosphorylase family protein
VKIDFGIMEINDVKKVTNYKEKPILEYLVSMGVYVFEPKALDYIKPGEKIDFPDLVKRLIQSGEKVQAYLSDDYWLDIGRPEDYQRAIMDFEKMRSKFLK